MISTLLLIFLTNIAFAYNPNETSAESVESIVVAVIANNSALKGIEFSHDKQTNDETNLQSEANLSKTLIPGESGKVIPNYFIPFKDLKEASQFQNKVQDIVPQNESYTNLIALFYDYTIQKAGQQNIYNAYVDFIDQSIRKHSGNNDSLVIIDEPYSNPNCEVILALSYDNNSNYYSRLDSFFRELGEAKYLIVDCLEPKVVNESNFIWIPNILLNGNNNVIGILNRTDLEKRSRETIYLYEKIISNLFKTNLSLFEVFSNSASALYEEGSIFANRKPVENRFTISGTIFEKRFKNDAIPAKPNKDLEDQNLMESPRIAAYPNPFNPEITIKIDGIPSDEQAEVELYDITGKLVTKYLCCSNGEYVWNGMNSSGQLLSGGVYILIVKTSSFKLSKRIIFLK